MEEMILWTPIEILLRSSMIYLGVFGAFRYFSRARSLEIKQQKDILLAFAFGCLSIGLSSIFQLSAAFYYPGVYENGVYIGLRDDTVFPVHQILIVSNSIIYLGIILFVFNIEQSTRRTKYLLTITSVIFYVLHIIAFWPVPTNRALTNLSIALIYTTFLSSVIVLLLTSSKEFQNYALFFIAAISINMLMGILITPEIDYLLISISILFTILPDFFNVISAIIYVIPAFFSMDRMKKLSPLVFLVIILSLIYIGLIFQIIFIEIVGIGAFFVYLTIASIISLLAINVIRNTDKSAHLQPQMLTNDTSTTSSLDKNLLDVFSRPDKLTDEEVSVSKERKVCLVCKGKINGITYICRECETFYCTKCYDALVNLENRCWACDLPLDETKPSKALEEKEKQAEIIEANKIKKTKKNLRLVKNQ